MTNSENINKDSFSTRIKTSLKVKESSDREQSGSLLDKLRHISGSKITDSTVIDTQSPKSTSRKNKPTLQEEFECLNSKRYEIVEEIGSGGFGRVYKGFDTKLSREIAIKTVRFDTNVESVSLFEHEARTLAQCNHPNIVQVHDVLKSNNSSCIVMEFINGPNICEYAATLKESKERWQRILCSHIADLVDALCYIHKREIYHQDIKPKNILVSLNNSCAKIVDFGLATDYFADNDHSGLSGTYGYMPPEKFTGKSTPKMHDIYAFGAVLFELFTGRVAHPGNNAREIASHVVEGRVEFIAKDRVNEQLQQICLKCLEKDPKKRYQSFEDIYNDVMKYLGGCTTTNDYPFLSLVADNKKLVFPLTSSKNFIGRTFNNQIVIPDPSISRSQAVIEVNEIIKIKNLSEVNKIKVGNIELGYEQKMQLVGHETIKIADYVFHYIPRSEIQNTTEIVVEVEGENAQIVNRVVTPISASQKEARKIGLTYSQIDNGMWETTIATQKNEEAKTSPPSIDPKTSLKSQDIQELQSSIDKLKKTIEQFERKLSQQQMEFIMDIFDRLQNRSSVRSFDTTKSISLEHEQKIIGAAQRASTSFNLQTYCFISIKNSENRKKLAALSGEQWFICKASLFYVVCVDLHKMDFVAHKSGYKYHQKDLVEGFLMACIDTAIAGQTAALAAENLGYGICMIGGIRNHVDKVCDVLQLPQLVVPLFGLCVGHPRKVNPPKPRLPLSGILLEDTYDKSSVEKAIEEYDQQMAESGLYENREFPKSDIEELREVAKDKYGWIEHCARRIATQDPLKSRADLLRILRERGFPLGQFCQQYKK